MTTQRMSSRLLHTDQFVMSDVFTLQSTTKRTTVMYQTKTLEGQLKRAAGSQQIHRVCCRLEFENDSTCAHQGRRQIRRSIFVYRLSVHVIPLYYYAHLFSSVRRARTGLGLNPQINLFNSNNRKANCILATQREAALTQQANHSLEEIMN